MHYDDNYLIEKVYNSYHYVRLHWPDAHAGRWFICFDLFFEFFFDRPPCTFLETLAGVPSSPEYTSPAIMRQK